MIKLVIHWLFYGFMDQDAVEAINIYIILQYSVILSESSVNKSKEHHFLELENCSILLVRKSPVLTNDVSIRISISISIKEAYALVRRAATLA